MIPPPVGAWAAARRENERIRERREAEDAAERERRASIAVAPSNDDGRVTLDNLRATITRMFAQAVVDTMREDDA